MVEEKITGVRFGDPADPGTISEHVASGGYLIDTAIYPTAAIQPMCESLLAMIGQDKLDGKLQTRELIVTAGHEIIWDYDADTYSLQQNGVPYTQEVAESLVRACALASLYVGPVPDAPAP